MVLCLSGQAEKENSERTNRHRSDSQSQNEQLSRVERLQDRL